MYVPGHLEEFIWAFTAALVCFWLHDVIQLSIYLFICIFVHCNPFGKQVVSGHDG